MASNVEGKFQYLIETKELIKAAIQEKGQTVSDSTPFREYASKIQAIEQSVVSPDVCYVTFKNGSTTLYKKAVAVGDDCVDVLAKGLLTTTPTKASTAQYHYTYSGWSRTNGGAASDTALSSVTANRTVYAAFTSSVRSYTITYYDSDGTTVLKTETLAYGATPSYEPKKDGYEFDGWTTTVTAVTGNASYTAKWKAAAAFATASWSEIKTIVDNGESATYFKLGDKRTETLTYADGTTEDITFEIAQVELDYKTTGNLAQPKRLVLLSTTVLSTPCVWQRDKPVTTSANAKYFGWGSYIETYLQNTVTPAFSEELQEAMLKVKAEYTTQPATFANGSVTIPRPEELYGSNDAHNTSQHYDMDRLEMFKGTGISAKICKDVNGVARQYWLASLGRKSSTSSTMYPMYVNESGKLCVCADQNDVVAERYIRPLIVI